MHLVTLESSRMEMQEVHVVFMPVDVHSAAHGSRSNIDFQVTSNIFCEAIAAMPWIVIRLRDLGKVS